MTSLMLAYLDQLLSIHQWQHSSSHCIQLSSTLEPQSGVSSNYWQLHLIWGFLNWGYPQIIQFNKKTNINDPFWDVSHLWKPPISDNLLLPLKDTQWHSVFRINTWTATAPDHAGVVYQPRLTTGSDRDCLTCEDMSLLFQHTVCRHVMCKQGASLPLLASLLGLRPKSKSTLRKLAGTISSPNPWSTLRHAKILVVVVVAVVVVVVVALILGQKS